jgi:hypothetical protein
MSDDGHEGITVRRARVTSPVAKTANVKRILERALSAAKEHRGGDRISGVFMVLVTENHETIRGWALTYDEAAALAEAVPEALEKALATLRAAATKPAP